MLEDGRMAHDRHKEHPNVTEDTLILALGRPGLGVSHLGEAINEANDCASQTGIVSEDEYMAKNVWSNGGRLDEHSKRISEQKRVGERGESSTAPLWQQTFDNRLSNGRTPFVLSILETERNEFRETRHDATSHLNLGFGKTIRNCRSWHPTASLCHLQT